MNTALSLLPPLMAILLALATRQIILSLLAGVFAGVLILNGFSPYASFTSTIELLVRVLADEENARIVLFSLMIGSILFLVERSGGVKGFVALLSQSRAVNSRRKAGLLAIFTGISFFLEGCMSILTVGTLCKPIFKKFKISREKLAYLANSTCAPAKVLIPLNGWGAYLLMQFRQAGVENPVTLLVQSVPYFFYPWIAILFAFLSVVSNWNMGPMKDAENRALTGSDQTDSSQGEEGPDPAKAVYFLLPMGTLVFFLFAFMAITGQGRIIDGDGSKSILYSIFVTLIVSFIFYGVRRVFNATDFMKACLDGMSHLLEVVLILVLAFAINLICRELKTGVYAAGLLGAHLPHFALPALVFFISAAISFSTGTSWGTFAIMLSVALPMAFELRLPLPLITGAVVSGGVWGDHCSPISGDTTVLAALASDCPVLDHVRTQLPYAVLGAFLSIILFLVIGFFTI